MATYTVKEIRAHQYIIQRDSKFLWFDRVRFYSDWLLGPTWVKNPSFAKLLWNKDDAIKICNDFAGITEQEIIKATNNGKTVYTTRRIIPSNTEEELTFQLGEALRHEKYEQVESLMKQLKEIG